MGTHRQDSQTRYQAVHHMFVASAKAISQGKKILGDIKFGAMFALSELHVILKMFLPLIVSDVKHYFSLM